MKSHNIPARSLAIVAGIASTAGALAILCSDAITSGHWTLDHALMPVMVGTTIIAGHLVGAALRSWRVGSAAGFAALFLVGTGLTVYTSVGRQAQTADTQTMTAETRNAAISDQVAAVKASKRRLADAENEISSHTNNKGCGRICNDWKTRAEEIRSHLAIQEIQLQRLGSPEPVAPRAERAADVLALFGYDKARAKDAFRKFESFAYSLFLEMTAIVAFGFAFRHSAPAPRVVTEITPEPGPALTAEPNGTDRRAAVHSFVAAHIARHGRAPTLPALQKMHRETFRQTLPKSTASRWRLEAEAHITPARRLRVVG